MRFRQAGASAESEALSERMPRSQTIMNNEPKAPSSLRN